MAKKNNIPETAVPYYKRLILVSNLLIVTQKKVINYRVALIIIAVMFIIENIYLWDSGILTSAVNLLLKK